MIALLLTNFSLFRLYEYLKSKKVSVRTAGKGGGDSKLNFDEVVDHHLEKIKKDALSDEEDYSMSSDDSDFNPDLLEALSAKEEYDSEPSSTSGSDVSDVSSGSDAEKRKEEKKRAKKERKSEKKEIKEKVSNLTASLKISFATSYQFVKS